MNRRNVHSHVIRKSSESATKRKAGEERNFYKLPVLWTFTNITEVRLLCVQFEFVSSKMKTRALWYRTRRTNALPAKPGSLRAAKHGTDLWSQLCLRLQVANPCTSVRFHCSGKCIDPTVCIKSPLRPPPKTKKKFALVLFLIRLIRD